MCRSNVSLALRTLLVLVFNVFTVGAGCFEWFDVVACVVRIWIELLAKKLCLVVSDFLRDVFVYRVLPDPLNNTNKYRMTKRQADVSLLQLMKAQVTQPQFIVGDCLEHLKKISTGTVKLVFSSPPYNIGKQYEKTQALTDYLKFQGSVIDQLCRVVCTDGAVCWQVGNHVSDGTINPLDLEVEPLFSKNGFLLRRRFVWSFGHGLHCSYRFSGRYETVVVFSRRELTPRPTAITMLEHEWASGFIVDAPNVKSNHVEKTDHPCQFPIELAERFIVKLTNEGDTVLDPFAGVCTTSIAASLRSRESICIELKAEYVRVGKSRFSSVRNGTIKHRSLGTKIHVPDPETDSVAKRPAAFDNAVNASLKAELEFDASSVESRTTPCSAAPRHSLLLVDGEKIEKVSSALVEKSRSVAVVVRSAVAEQLVYSHCRSVGLTLLNRIVVSGVDYTTIFWFVGNVAEYDFDLDAVRVPSKYPGKKAAGSSEFSGNPLGKNPSDVWSYCEHVGASCPRQAGFGLPLCCLQRIVRALVPVGGTLCAPAPVADKAATVVTKLKRNLVQLAGFDK